MAFGLPQDGGSAGDDDDGVAVDGCDTIKCSADCEDECGWVMPPGGPGEAPGQGMCVRGKRTSQADAAAMRGDCAGKDAGGGGGGGDSGGDGGGSGGGGATAGAVIGGELTRAANPFEFVSRS